MHTLDLEAVAVAVVVADATYVAKKPPCAQGPHAFQIVLAAWFERSNGAGRMWSPGGVFTFRMSRYFFQK